ncbi:MAG: UDP-3-O-(3-hydroxymyristoyl)glucosamine N-acyltransferase [Deltaproteobacteria bacterium]|nr:MAG: UDP-3-O-(3-hydroxymyristoyl)glucosamine N-acyltransferase [Deltaproteobacteria bacterium]
MRLRLSEIASRVGAELRGPDAAVTGAASLDDAGPDDLSLCVNLKYLAALKATRAGAVIVPRGNTTLIEAAPCATLLAEKPRLVLARVLDMLYPRAQEQPGIDGGAKVAESAQVAGSARIEAGAVVCAGAFVGERTIVRAGAVIAEGAVVGADCEIGYNAVVCRDCSIGNGVVIGPGSVVGAPGFGVVEGDSGPESIPQVGRVVVEDGARIGANCTIDRATMGVTRIGRRCHIDDQVHVGHNVVMGPGCVIAAQCGISGSVRIGSGVMLGGQVGVADGAQIGDGAMVGGKSGVVGVVEPAKRVAGIPAVDANEWLSRVVRRGRQKE